MKLEISQQDYDDYHAKKETVVNSRIRPDDQDFFDALLSVDMNDTPEGKEVLKKLEKIGALE